MGDKVTVEPAELVRLAQTTLDMAMEIIDAWRRIHTDLRLPDLAFGNPYDGWLKVADKVVENMGVALERHAADQEDNADRLLQAASNYAQADADNAARFTPAP